MARDRILVDSSYLFALFALTDKNHERTLSFNDIMRVDFVIPDVVLTEAAFLFNRQGGILAVALFIERLKGMNPILEPVTFDDLKRVREIMLTYPSARLDFVDCCLMALSEKLGCVDISA